MQQVRAARRAPRTAAQWAHFQKLERAPARPARAVQVAKTFAGTIGSPDGLQSPRASRELEGRVARWVAGAVVTLRPASRRHRRGGWKWARSAKGNERGRTGESVYVQYARSCGLMGSCRLFRLTRSERVAHFFEVAHHRRQRHLHGRLRSYLFCELQNRLDKNLSGELFVSGFVRPAGRVTGGRERSEFA